MPTRELSVSSSLVMNCACCEASSFFKKSLALPQFGGYIKPIYWTESKVHSFSHII